MTSFATADARGLRPTIRLGRVAAGVLVVLSTTACGHLRADELDDARRLERTGRWEEALEGYEALLETNPADVAPGMLRTLAMIGDADALAAARKKFEDARFDSPGLALERADDAFRRGRYDEARAALVKLAESDPSARAYWLASEVALEAGDVAAALAACDAALKLHVDAPRSLDDLRFVAKCEGRIARFRGEPERFRRLVREFYPKVLEDSPDAWWAAFDAAALYFEKFDGLRGTRHLDVARSIAPRQPELHALQVRQEIESFRPDAALRTVAKLEAIGAFPVEAAQLRADAELTLFRFDAAIEALRQGLAFNPHDARTLGRLQAIHATRGAFALDGPVENSAEIEGWIAEHAPKCGRFYEAAGDCFNQLRKYPQAQAAYAEALRRTPESGDVSASIGLVQMRMGEEVAGRETLTRAFEYDPYNVRVKNQLETLDQLDGYAVLETEHFILRFERTWDELLARNAAYVLEKEIYPDVTGRLGYEPRGKTLIEIFSDGRGLTGHEWFSARMTGLPYVGTIGACAGRVIAMVSPKSYERPFSWARVLRHEYVHVVNLEQTEFNVPHWLTEGLAVWIEDLPRPHDWTATLARRREQKKLFDLASINSGFVRPDSPEDWTLAYAQSELYVETLHERHGTEGLRELLSQMRQGKPFGEALEAAVGMTPQELEAAFAEELDAILTDDSVASVRIPPSFAELTRRFEEDPTDVGTTADLAEAYALKGDFEKAVPFARAALAKSPHHPVATSALARAAIARGDDDEANETLLAAERALGHPNERLTALRIAIALRREDFAAAGDLYLAATKAWPSDPRWRVAAAKVFERTERRSELVDVLTPLGEREHDDPATAEKLFELCVALDRDDAAERWAEALLRIDPDQGSAHAFVGRRAFARGDFERAEVGLSSAQSLRPEDLSYHPELIDLAIRRGDRRRADRMWRRLREAAADSSKLTELRKRIDELP